MGFNSGFKGLRTHGKRNFFPWNILALYGTLRFITVFKRILGKTCQFLYCRPKTLFNLQARGLSLFGHRQMHIPHNIQYCHLHVDFVSAICRFVVLLVEIKAIKVTLHNLFKDNTINPLSVAQIIMILRDCLQNSAQPSIESGFLITIHI